MRPQAAPPRLPGLFLVTMVNNCPAFFGLNPPGRKLGAFRYAQRKERSHSVKASDYLYHLDDLAPKTPNLDVVLDGAATLIITSRDRILTDALLKSC